MIYPVSPKRATISPLWPRYVLPALERQGPKETIGKLATHMIYISPLWPTYVLPALESQGARETIGKLATHVIYISGGQ